MWIYIGGIIYDELEMKVSKNLSSWVFEAFGRLSVLENYLEWECPAYFDEDQVKKCHGSEVA